MQTVSGRLKAGQMRLIVAGLKPVMLFIAPIVPSVSHVARAKNNTVLYIGLFRFR
jgi:hypothetical protein